MRRVLILTTLLGLLVLINGVSSLAAARAEEAYLAECVLTLPGSGDGSAVRAAPTTIPCAVSLFAHFNFRTSGQLVYDRQSTLCADSLQTQPAALRALNEGSTSTVLAVNRGACSFDEKAINAEKLGYRALLVVDPTPLAETEEQRGAAAAVPSPFPMGATDSSYKARIPVLMVRVDSLVNLLWNGRECAAADAEGGADGCPAAAAQVSLLYSKAPSEGTGHGSSVASWRAAMNQAPLLLGRAGLCLLCVFLVLATLSSSGNSALSSGGVVSGEDTPTVSPQTSGKKPAEAAAEMGGAEKIGADSLSAKDTSTSTLSRSNSNSSTGSSSSSSNSSENSKLTQIRNFFFFLVPYIIVIFFAAACRLGTYRVLVADGFAQYHHNETDEKVFEALTRAVELDWRNYRVTRDDISRLRLSPENYGDNLFIHPPFFVYVSMLLVKYLGVSLATVSLLFHLGVMLLLPIMVHYCGFDVRDQWKRHRRDPLQTDDDNDGENLDISAPPVTSISAYYSEGAVTLWALVIYTLDPLAFFCSQKFWIDNALLFSVTAAATIHMVTWRRVAARRPRTKLRLALRALSSGFIYGMFVLNCKITGLAQLPFMLSWIFVSMIEVVGFWTIITCCFVPYMLGAAVAYMPWLWVYYTHTGRWLPNAWPSASMLKDSAFLRLALSKPVTYYVEMLLEFSPMQILGISFGAVVSMRYIGKHMWQFLHCNSRRARINGENFVAYGGSGHVTALIAWPTAFLAGLTLVGMFGGGFQARFMLPILPATSVLAARCVHRASSIRHGNSTSLAGVHVLTVVALAYSSMHCLYYGMLFTNLYADLDLSMFSVLSKILSEPYAPVSSPQVMQEMLRFMTHFGLHLKSQ